MVRITITDDYVTCDGHAGDNIRCAMLSAVTVSMLSAIEATSPGASYKLAQGQSELSLHGLTHDGRVIAAAYIEALRGLAADHPEHFSICDPAGSSRRDNMAEP